jgi:hypothetical protein
MDIKVESLVMTKYKEMLLDAAETVLGYFGFDRTSYGNKKNTASRKWWWLKELRQEREKDIRMETLEGKQLSINWYLSILFLITL